MLCKNCRAELIDNSVYCHICGKKQFSQPKRRLHRGKSQGTITKIPGKRKNAYWARLPVDYSSGTPERKSIGCFHTYNDAAEALAKAMYVCETSHESPAHTTLQMVYEQFTESNYFTGLSKSAQGAHRTAWKHLSSVSQIPVTNVTKETFQVPIDSLHQSGKKRETLAKVRNLSSLLCQEAMGMGLMVTNYGQLVQLPKKDSKGSPPFTSADLKQIWAEVDNGNSTAMAVQLLNYTGMRPGEMLSIRIEEHLLQHGAKWYIRNGSKTDKGRNRIIPLPDILIPCLSALMDDRTSGPLIQAPGGGPYRLDNWRPRCFNTLMEQLNISGHTPYSCRHTYADLQKRRNIDPEIMMEIMGHEDYATTVEHYHTTTDEDLDRIFQAVDGITRPK